MVSSLRRLAADHAALHDDLPPNYFFPTDDSDDLTQLTTFLAGPQGTPYAQGLWRLHLKMPDDYPKSPPKATFRTRIWHPNVEESTGAVCVDTLKRDWKATLTLKDVLVTISCLLIYPNPDSALNSTAGALLQENYEAFARQAKLMTSIHAPVPSEYKDSAKEARSRGDDGSTGLVPEQEEATTRSLRSRKGPSQTVTMKKTTRRTHRTVTPPLPTHRETHEPEPTHQPDEQPRTPTGDNGDSDDDSENLSNASKENDPSLSPSPVKFAPPSPRKNALGKRPLSVLTMPLDPVDDPFGMDAEEFDGPDAMTASEKNVAANFSSSSSSSFDAHNRHPDPERSPQRKSPKLSVLSKGVNSSGRIRDDLNIFEDAPEITIEDLDRRSSGDGKENHHRALGESKGELSVSRSQHASQSTSLLAPPASTAPSSSKGAKPLGGTRKVSGPGAKKAKPRIGIRRL